MGEELDKQDSGDSEGEEGDVGDSGGNEGDDSDIDGDEGDGGNSDPDEFDGVDEVDQDTDGCDDGSGDDDGGASDDESPSKKKRKLRDAREGKTIFIRNLPFDATEEEICDVFEKFGEIAYCKIVVDSATEHSRGSAFVKFQEKQSADECLKKYGDGNNGSEGENEKPRI